MKFANIECLLLLFFIIPYIWWYLKKRKSESPHLQVSTTWAYKDVPKTYKNYLYHAPFLLRVAALVLVVFILARPQRVDKWQDQEMNGIDIMLAMDVSTSMLAEDLKPNRIEAAKMVATEFINSRPNDNIGLTVFAGESFTQCPLTTDHGVLLNFFQSVDANMAMKGLINDGTAIGMGLSNAISRLKDSKANSKVIILLTDGTNNSGDISPLTAAEIAKTFSIRIYTIGVGKTGMARYPVQTNTGIQYIKVPVEIDEKTLQNIAESSDGLYFRASSTSKLKSVYAEIDKLEKTKLDVKKFSRREDVYAPLAMWVFLLLLIDLLLRNTILKKIP